jgi:hypothetical protein
MKVIVYTVLLCIGIKASSQKLESTVIDSHTNKVIPFSTIKIVGKNEGVYSNENGGFSILVVPTDTLAISHIGYKTLEIPVNKVTSNIVLTPKEIDLKEVIVSNKKPKTKEIGYHNKGNKNLTWHIGKEMELAVFIPNNLKKNDNVTAYIEKVFIPIKKKELIIDKKTGKAEERDTPFKSVFRLHFYTSDVDQKPKQENLIASTVVSCNENVPDIMELNISAYTISFPKEGIIVSIEMIGMLDDNGRIVYSEKLFSARPGFKFTQKETTANSYYKKIFQNNGEWRPMSEIRTPINKDYNLAIGLAVKIYEN